MFQINISFNLLFYSKFPLKLPLMMLSIFFYAPTIVIII